MAGRNGNMKPIIVSFFCLCLANFSNAKTWHRVDQQATTMGLSAPCFSDSIHGWALGTNGSVPWNTFLIGTDDGGASWKMLEPEFSYPVWNVSFGDSLHGIAIGDTGLWLKTEDGGKTWRKMLKRTNRALNTASCFGKDTAWVASDGAMFGLGTVFRTCDGGSTWNNVLCCTGSAYFYDSKTFWTIDSGYQLVKSTDCGESFTSWNYKTSCGDPGILFVNDSCGWVFDRGRLTSTNDRGKTWKVLVSGDMYYQLFPMRQYYFVNQKDGESIGNFNRPVLLCTNDGGESWQIDNSPAGLWEGAPSDISCDKQGNEWAVVGPQIYTTKEIKPISVSSKSIASPRRSWNARCEGTKLIITNANPNTSVNLFDVTGRKVLSQGQDRAVLGREGKIAIDVRSLATGTYICVLGEGGWSTARLVHKQR
jgi:photosystem II stability/assembly factor-like uncharacterized protein